MRLALVLLAACAAGCVTDKPAEAPAVPEPELLFGKIEAGDQSAGAVKATAKAKVRNPASAAAKVVGARWESSGGVAVKGEVTLDVAVPGGGDADVEIPLSVDLSGAPKNATSFGVDLTVTLAVEGPAGATELPVTGGFMVRAARIATVKLEEVTASRYEDHVSITFGLAVSNENTFPISVRRIGFKVFIDGKEMEAHESGAARVAAGRAQVVELVQKLDAVTYPDIQTILKRRSLGYRVLGEVETDAAKIPIDLSGKVEFRQDDG